MLQQESHNGRVQEREEQRNKLRDGKRCGELHDKERRLQSGSMRDYGTGQLLRRQEVKDKAA